MEIDTDDDDESDFAYLCPADVFLTGKAVRSEIKLKDLSPENRAKFLASMEKEWTSRLLRSFHYQVMFA